MKIDRNRGKITRKIDLSQFFGGEDAYITLGELTYDELIDWSELGKKAKAKNDPRITMQSIKKYIVDHNFESDFDGVTRALTVDEVFIELLKSAEIALYIQEEFIKILPLGKTSETKLPASLASDLQDSPSDQKAS